MARWYEEAVIYEVHVKCFYDSSATGMGDFKGLKEKLDYLQDLGVTAIWLLPFYPSPLKDDGYDIGIYTDVHPHYGTLRDFREFLKAAHERGLRVITELVINHTSDQHPWFQRARKKDAKDWERNFYVWSDTPTKYKDARIIFQDFEHSNWTWDHEAGLYYWHRFYSHQPDLNFESPAVQAAVFRVLSFWFKMGVDGVRLDAVPYLYEQEGTSCENLPKTHAFLKKLRAYVDNHFPDKMLLAEANQWPEEAAQYFGSGDECHMAFHFPLMPRLFMSIHLEDSLPITEIMDQTPPIPEECQWALFLRNHDELTLEMVTDEERDYMYRVYAHDPQARVNLGIRRRLAPLLKNDRRKIELMNILLFSLEGTPVLYYGDEIGMGDNIYLGDRNGVRTPMQWSSDKNAGFSRANPQQLYLPPIIDPEYHFETVNVEAQLKNPHSLLRWTKQLIALRKRYKAFSKGTTTFLPVKNRKMLVFFRESEQELLMIVVNLSRYPQYVELDLKQYNGYSLVEMFSGERFPSIGTLPYFLTLSPYGYYWFSLVNQEEKKASEQLERAVTHLAYGGDKRKIFHLSERRFLESILKQYLRKKHWFRKILHQIDKSYIRLIDHLEFNKGGDIHLFFVEIHYLNGASHLIPLFIEPIEGERMHQIEDRPHRVIAQLQGKEKNWALLDVGHTDELLEFLSDYARAERRHKSEEGELRGISFDGHEKGHVKLFSQMEEGINVDVEMRSFLAKRTQFKSFLPLHGYLEYRGPGGLVRTLAEISAPLHEEFRAKENCVEAALRFLQEVQSKNSALDEAALLPKKTMVQMALESQLPEVIKLFDGNHAIAQQMGEAAARFHSEVWKASSVSSDFSPIFYTLFYQRSLYQRMLRKVNEGFSALRSEGKEDGLDQLKNRVLKLMAPFSYTPLHTARIRHHGNLILENVYFTGKDVIFTNFGEVSSLVGNLKKYKRSPVRDLVSMIVSIIEAGFEAAEKLKKQGLEDVSHPLSQWALIWGLWTATLFLSAYLKCVPNASFLPPTLKELDFQMGIFLIEKCMEGLISKNRTDFGHYLIPHWLSIYES